MKGKNLLCRGRNEDKELWERLKKDEENHARLNEALKDILSEKTDLLSGL